ncbi:SEC-C metal-binding domain-containing protein, partial [Idiomarina sp. A28L]|uniref:SEC-C metal-binding domain-containing protein n=1 Tax=Idiomarina sp. A28L TaxID=1036674 RepID=UPI003FCDA06B
MERNEPCWCGSGKKWKVCHRDRHKQEVVPPGKITHEISVAQQRGLCLHPDAGVATCTN